VGRRRRRRRRRMLRRNNRRQRLEVSFQNGMHRERSNN
jgi:hypothetical protein